jgi:hypothetical protein
MTFETSQFFTIADFVEPVLRRLQQFNSGANHQREDIKSTLQRLVKNGHVDGISLLPDLNQIAPVPVKPEISKLLIAKCCEAYVKLVLEPRFGKRGRLPKHQKDFAYTLQNEIYELENGQGGGFHAFQ